MQTVACPPAEQLKAYLSGRLDEDQSEVLAQHLLACQACEQTAIHLELEPDTLVELLQTEAAQAPAQYSADEHLRAIGDDRRSYSDSSSGADMPHIPTVPHIPTLLGQYELQKRLGTGGMGAVYLGRHRSLDKQVAIKLLPALPAQNAEFVARFQREMRAAGRLDHPAIVRTTDAGEHQGIHYLVMDAIDGMDLGRLVRAEEKLSIADACEVARQAAVGLAHAHEKGIVHRDVKPSNLMLESNGQIRILDFGLAQIGFWESGSAEITTVGQLMGTLDYMAPEQAERGGAVDYRADLYSLGATLFRLLTGRAPLAAAPNLTPLEKLRLLATHRPPKLRSLRPDAPEALSQIVDAMLAREPSQRPASAIHAAELLEPFGTESDLSSLLQRARSKPLVDEPSFVINPLLQRDLAELHSGSSIQPDHRAASSSGGKRRGRWITWLSAAGFLAMICSGILLVLETSKGQLVIDSEADVQVKLVAVDERGQRAEVERLQIEPGTQVTRLKSGKYEITIDSASDSIGVTNGSFTIQRGQTVVATITQNASTAAQAAIPAVSSGVVSADPRLNQIVFDNETLDTWLRKLEFERNPSEIVRALTAIQELASDDLQDVMREPLIRFAQRTKNSEYHGRAIAALSECCGETLHEAVGEILAAVDDEALRSSVFHWSIFEVLNGGISQIGPNSLFLTEALRLLDSDSPKMSLNTALLLRGMLWESPAGQGNREVQQLLLDKFANTAALTDENFWLAYPGSDYVLLVFRLQRAGDHGGGQEYHIRKTAAGMLDAIVNRAISALSDPSTTAKVQTQGSIVLRSLFKEEEEIELSVSQRKQIAQSIARDLKQASEDLSRCTVEVELPRWFAPYVAPRMPADTISFEASNEVPVDYTNAISQTLNLALATGVQDDVRNELQALFEALHGSPLHDELVARDLRERQDWEWARFIARYKRVGSPWTQLIYLQAGKLLDKPINELLKRFTNKLPSDLARSIEFYLDEIESRPDQLSNKLNSLYQLPIESHPRGVQVLETLASTLPVDSNGLRVWMKAAGDDFPASYARALENAAGEQRLRLLNVELTAFPDFRCDNPDALRPLLDWCDQTIRADSQQEYRIAIISTLSQLVTDKPCNSVECQRMVVEQLENYAFLNDQDFWLARPLFTGVPEPWGPPMRQAVLRQAFARIAKGKDANDDEALLCQALAIVREGLADWEAIPPDFRLEAFEQMRERLARAAETPGSQAVLTQTPTSFVKLIDPIFVGVQLTSEDSGTGYVQTNSVILILNLLTASRESNPKLPIDFQPSVQALHDRTEQLVLIDPDLSRWGVAWRYMLGRSDAGELLPHTWYMQTGGLLGHDVNILRERPRKLYEQDRERKRRFVQPRDTLAIHVPGLLPQSGDPPVLQAGTSTPVVGFPVPVAQGGTIQLPMLDPIQVADLELAEVRAKIDQQYVEQSILSGKTPRGISVEFLLRADQAVELRNIAGSPSVTTPDK